MDEWMTGCVLVRSCAFVHIKHTFYFVLRLFSMPFYDIIHLWTANMLEKKPHRIIASHIKFRDCFAFGIATAPMSVAEFHAVSRRLVRLKGIKQENFINPISPSNFHREIQPLEGVLRRACLSCSSFLCLRFAVSRCIAFFESFSITHTHNGT